MSRFYGESSSSSSSEEDSDAEAEVQVEQGANRFEFDSSSDDEEKRVVRSNRDKRYEDMQAKIAEIKNHVRDMQLVQVSANFDELQKLLAKAKNIVAREGLPKFYIKAVLSIKALVQRVSQSKTKMNKSNTKAHNGLKQKMKKWSKQYAAAVEAYLANPLVSEEEKEEPDSGFDSDSDLEDPQPSTTAGDGDDSEDTDSEDWDSDMSSDDDDSGDEVVGEDGAAVGGIQYTRAYWMKKPEEIEDLGKLKARRLARAKEKEERGRKAKEARAAKRLEKEQKEKKVYTPEMIMKALKDLLDKRGRRGTDRKSMMKELELLSTKATAPAAVLKVQVALASAYFEMNLNKGVYMNIPVWRKCSNVLVSMLDTLEANPEVRLSEGQNVEEIAFEGSDDEEAFRGIIQGSVATPDRKKKQKEEEEEEEEEDDGFLYVNGNFYSFLFRLVSEFTRSLQEINPQTIEYVDRLRDEAALASLCAKGAEYYRKLDKLDYQCQATLLQLELQYYHYQPSYDKIVSADAKDPKSSVVVATCAFLYANADVRTRTRALLAHVYFCARHNWFEQARDLTLMSHVQDGINDADVITRILFNRTMAQMGLCAFRNGKYLVAMNCLADLFMSQRIKELLAQGISSNRFHERDAKQEKLEKKRQFPFHMHINLDVLESVHLTSAMFIEVENIATGRRKVISKIFRKIYKDHNNSLFTAPPEDTRDLIRHAAKNLQKGNWRVCSQSLSQLRMWNYLSNSEATKARLIQQIKEISVRMYLNTYGSSYVSMSMESLTTLFELPEATIHRITSKMMFSNHLAAVWDQPTKSLIMHAAQPTALQRVALRFADKASIFVEQNERLLDQRHGYYQKGDNNRWKGRNKQKSNFGGVYRSR